MHVGRRLEIFGGRHKSSNAEASFDATVYTTSCSRTCATLDHLVILIPLKGRWLNGAMTINEASRTLFV